MSLQKGRSFLQVYSEVRQERNTMVPMRKPHFFLNAGCFPGGLATILIIMLLLRDGDADKEFRGKVGGDLTIHCSSLKDKEIKLFYLQRETQGDAQFVNGFYEDKPIAKTWPGTTLDLNNTSVHFHNLNVSNNGKYQCIIMYKDDKPSDPIHHHLQLIVTAAYSKPTVSVNCFDENHASSCMVTCFSHGGYPGTKVTWNVSVPVNGSGQAWKVGNSREVSDPNSKLVNSSSTAFFNCSNRVPQSFSCSVGDVISDIFTVCEPEKPPGSYTPLVIAAICVMLVVLVFGIILFVLLLKKCRKPARRREEVESTYLQHLNTQNGGGESS